MDIDTYELYKELFGDYIKDKRYAEVIEVFEENENELEDFFDILEDYVILENYIWALWLNDGTEDKSFQLAKKYKDKYSLDNLDLVLGHYCKWKGWYEDALEYYENSSEEKYNEVKKVLPRIESIKKEAKKYFEKYSQHSYKSFNGRTYCCKCGCEKEDLINQWYNYNEPYFCIGNHNIKKVGKDLSCNNCNNSFYYSGSFENKPHRGWDYEYQSLCNKNPTILSIVIFKILKRENTSEVSEKEFVEEIIKLRNKWEFDSFSQVTDKLLETYPNRDS